MKTKAEFKTYDDDRNVIGHHHINVSKQSEKDVIRKFNPTDNSNVDLIKVSCATVLSVLEQCLSQGGCDARNIAIAKTHIETAQMHAVKSLFVESK